MKFRRCHSKIWLPPNIKSMLLEFFETLPFVDVTNHAAIEMENDKNGIIPLPDKAELMESNVKLVEIYQKLENNQVIPQIQKIVLRVPSLSERFDYTYVVAREGFVVSAWSNDKNDNHRITEHFDYYYCPHKVKSKVKKQLLQDSKTFRRYRMQNV